MKKRQLFDRATPVYCAVETTTNPAEDWRAAVGIDKDEG